MQLNELEFEKYQGQGMNQNQRSIMYVRMNYSV